MDETAVVPVEVTVHYWRKHCAGASAGERYGGQTYVSERNNIQDLCEEMDWWEFFSTCGKLVRHYTVIGWLGSACKYVKRPVEGVSWVREETIATMQDAREKVKVGDLVKGSGYVFKQEKRLYRVAEIV